MKADSMWLHVSICAISVSLCAGCGRQAAATSDAASPALGAHTLLAQDQGKGTGPATTAAVTTRPEGSVLLAVSMGRSPNFATPTDSYRNTWAAIGRRNMYADGPFYTAVWSAVRAKGGMGHTLSAAKPSDPVDEISLAFVEINDGKLIRDSVYAYPKIGQRMTPGEVVTNGPATLVAVWGGDGPMLTHTAVPSDGFQIIDSYLTLGPTSGVQIAIATKQVTAPGRYSLTWAATPPQGAACYLIAVE